MNEVDASVIVVGAGPVGLTLANYLGMAGVDVIVLEARGSLIDYPRGVGMDDETLRSFQAIGLVDNVLPHTTPNQWLRFVNGRGRTFASIEPRDRPYGWSRRNAFIQPLVDEVLLDGLARFDSVRVRWDHAVDSVTDEGDRVRVVTNGEQGELTAHWLVGTDGGRSIVRKSMGVSWDGTTSPTRWLVVDVRNDPVGTPNSYVYGDWRRPHVSIALPHGMRRFEFMLFEGEHDDEMSSPSRIDALLRELHPEIGRVDYIRQRVYTHHARVAGAFKRGRLMIAGDAAHLMPVWQGQGYNTGIRDATNLGWKLAAVVSGRARDELLDTYDVERRDHAAAMVRISQTAGILVRQTSRRTAMVRDGVTRLWDFIPPLKRYIVQMRYKPMPRYTRGVVQADVGGDGSPVGRLLPQPSVTRQGGAVAKLDDVLGTGFALLAWGYDPRPHLGAHVIAGLGRLGARLVVVVPITQLDADSLEEQSDARSAERVSGDAIEAVVVGDHTDAVKTWFDDKSGSAVLVRPDRFVAAIDSPLGIGARIAEVLTRIGVSASTSPTGTDQNPVQEESWETSSSA